LFNQKTVGEVIQKGSHEDFQKKVINRLYPGYSKRENNIDRGLYESRKSDIIVLRQ
jgi:hypothetical protein